MITTDQFRQFIQSKEEAALGIITPPTLYYLKVFETFGRKKFFLSWNWAAFFTTLFFGHLWFAYRKMYILAGLFWVLSNGIILGLAMLAIHIAPHFMVMPNPTFPAKIGYGIATLLLSNCMGVFGNAIYFATVRRSLKKGLKKEGTSSTAALLAFILGLFILSLVKRFGITHL